MHKLSVAPMLDWTDKHCRYLHRLISPQALLYSEMVTAPAILRGNVEKVLGYNAKENPVALQLGGSNPTELAQCCVIAQEYGYAQVNLNVGCPSDRVQKGRFGACLMNEPQLVKECVISMKEAVDIPITVKCRIGVDSNDSFENLHDFAIKQKEAGITTLIIHARKAWLKGLSPKQNRTVPPLNYEFVYRIKQLIPDIEIVINGGINTVEESLLHLQHVDGVMLGRSIWNNPWLLNELQNSIYPSTFITTRDKVLGQYIEYCQTQISNGVKLHWLLPPILNLFHGMIGNKKWKSYLVTQAPKRVADVDVFRDASKYLL